MLATNCVLLFHKAMSQSKPGCGLNGEDQWVPKGGKERRSARVESGKRRDPERKVALWGSGLLAKVSLEVDS